MYYVIDFIGFYIPNRFIIEEFCQCRVSKEGVKVGDPMLFAIDPNDVSSYGLSLSNIKEYYISFGIGIGHSRRLLSDLVEYMNQLLSTNKTIYVKNLIKLQQLKDFMNIPNNYKNVISLDTKGFDVYEIVMGTDCQYHDNKHVNYCARDSAKVMAYWLKKMESLRCVAVIDLSGYRTFSGNFRIKELSIMIVNNYGIMIKDILPVTVVPLAEDTSEELVKAYNKTYYDKYGIKWKSGNLPLPFLSDKVTKLLNKHDVTDIFVENYKIEIKLSSVIKDIFKFEIFRLEDYGYTDQVNANLLHKCQLHEHPDKWKNVCVKATNLQLVFFVIHRELYKMEVLEGIKKFKRLSQELLDVDNSSTSDSDLSNLSSNQSYTDSDVDSALTESSKDEKDDLLTEFNSDAITKILDDIDIDILLESEDVKNNEFSVVNFDIDLL